MDIRDKLERLYLKAAYPKSVDFYRPTMYRFDKFCKCCHAGLKKAEFHDRREKKALYGKGFCSKECQIIGPQSFDQVCHSSPDHNRSKGQHYVEEFAFLSAQIARMETKLKPVQNLLLFAERTFSLMSEKLRFMEMQTGEKWYPNKLYRTLERIERCRL